MTMPGAIIAASILAGHSQADSIDFGDESNLRTFCLSFRPDNKISLFPPSNQTVSLLRGILEKQWGVDRMYGGSNFFTFELEGAPFLMYSSRENALLIKYICSLILDGFRWHGWELVVCTDLSNKTDLTTWYFGSTPIIEDDTRREKTLDDLEMNSSLVCLSLSAKRKLQLINAPTELQEILRHLVLENYELGLEQDAHYGRAYQIKLKGSPWDTENRDEIVAGCSLMVATFREFGSRGYHLYGLVNLKDTADSLFFEYDPNQTLQNDQYMLMALDEENIIRLINAPEKLVGVVKAAIDYYWLYGIEAEGRIGSQRVHSQSKSPLKTHTDANLVCWEFVLQGSPWRVPASKMGRSRQFVTYILDALLAHGWTVVTGLDISRALNKKSALLFQSCPSVRGIRHACLSPLGKQRYQLINAPSELQKLVKEELEDVLACEKITEDRSVYEITLQGEPWWVTDPEYDKRYIYVRKRMNALLQTLVDAGWCVIASADVARQIQDDDGGLGEGIHSWFVIYCGNVGDTTDTGVSMKVTANSVLHVAGRVGTARPGSPCCRVGARARQRPSSSANTSPRTLSPVRARRTASFRPRKPSPASQDLLKIKPKRRGSTFLI